MPAEERFTFARRDVVLTSPGPDGPMQAQARATTGGLDLLWGTLATELRAQLEAGGCDRRAFHCAVAAAWRAWSEAAAGPMRLELREGHEGHDLVTLAGPDGKGAALAPLVRAAFFLEYRWKSETARLPIGTADDGGPDFWLMLPMTARAVLEGEGATPEGLTTQLLAQAREAIAEAGGRYVPSVFLPIGTKKRTQPAALRTWHENGGI